MGTGPGPGVTRTKFAFCWLRRRLAHGTRDCHRTGANSENIDLELASVLGSDSLTLLGMLPQNARQSVLDCCPTTLVIGFGRA